MKLMMVLSVSLWCQLALANLNQAPPNLEINNQEQAVFVDFKRADSIVQYDLVAGETRAKTTIKFYQPKTGRPIFDLIPDATSIILNGKSVKAVEVSLGNVSKAKYLDQVLKKGQHTVVIENLIDTNVSVKGWIDNKKSVRAAFWLTDLEDRSYLEQYLPTNLEYDQYPSTIEYEIIGSSDEHVIYTNGEVTDLAMNHWKVEYPSYFSASSFYLHISEKGFNYEEREFYRSIDGRDIPILAYSRQSPTKYMNEAKKVMAELEKDYGPWPHPQLIIYGAGSGGMEYAGATITSFSALGHELMHCYFARGTMPAHGNSGWVDEAIASWRDWKYRQASKYSLIRTSMGGHSVYRRHTDKAAYKMGRRFMGHLDEKFEKKGGMKKFLKDFFENRKFKPFKTPEFEADIEKFFNADVGSLFNKHVYGMEEVDKDPIWKRMFDENPMHPPMSKQDLLNLL